MVLIQRTVSEAAYRPNPAPARPLHRQRWAFSGCHFSHTLFHVALFTTPQTTIPRTRCEKQPYPRKADELKPVLEIQYRWESSGA